MAKGVRNRGGSGSCTEPERDGGNSSREQEPEGQGSPEPKALESGRTNRSKKARPRPRDSPEASIPTRRKTSPHCESKDPQAETWGAEIEKRKVSQSQSFPKNEGRYHRWNGEWPKKRRKGTTVTPVPTTRNGKEPVYSHNLQENSQTRFCQLDTTVARRKVGEKLERPPTGTERARQEKTCTSPSKSPRQGKSRRGQD